MISLVFFAVGFLCILLQLPLWIGVILMAIGILGLYCRFSESGPAGKTEYGNMRETSCFMPARFRGRQ